MEKFLRLRHAMIWHFMPCMGVAIATHVASAAKYGSASTLRVMHVETIVHTYTVAVVQ
jgi:hypothetical protein